MKIVQHQEKTRYVLMMSVFVGSLLLTWTPVQADTHYWTCGAGDGWWGYGGHWDVGEPPHSSDYAFLTSSDIWSRRVMMDDARSVDLSDLRMDATGKRSTMKLSIWYGNNVLKSISEYVGYIGRGIIEQSAGSHTISAHLYLGYSFGSSGTYNLSGTGSLSAHVETIGEYGTGVFNQTGGINTVTNDLYLGSDSGNATYSLSGGTLDVRENIVGGFGTNDFLIDGGILTNNWQSSNVDRFNVGHGSGSDVSFTINSRSVTSNYQTVGGSGAGTFNQTGGTNTVTNNLYLGLDSGGNGTYTLSGGTLDVKDSIWTGAGIGIVNIDGGTLTSNWKSINVSTFNVGFSGLSNGSFLMDSKSLQSNYQTVGGSGTGAFTQTGGSNTVTNNLYLGDAFECSGTYELSGTGSLSAYNEYIDYSGTGRFTQTGGANTVMNNLTLGYAPGGDGAYTLSGGALEVKGKIEIGGAGSSALILEGGTLFLVCN
jgi:hypothetical protein